MNSNFNAGGAYSGASGNDASADTTSERKTTGTALVPVSTGPLYGVEVDPREEAWSILEKATRTEAETPRSWRRRKNVAARANAVQAFDQLRTQILQAVRTEGLSRIAVAGPTSGSGSTFIAVNLARALARVPGTKTVLLDLNLRDPGVADTIGVEAQGDIDEFLSGEVSFFEHLVRYDEGLALGLSESARDSASDLLQSVTLGGIFRETETILRPDVVMLDLPPILEYDDLSAVLPHVDAVLLVADGNQTQAKHIEECERLITKRSKLMGVVLNRARA